MSDTMKRSEEAEERNRGYKIDAKRGRRQKTDDDEAARGGERS